MPREDRIADGGRRRRRRGRAPGWDVGVRSSVAIPHISMVQQVTVMLVALGLMAGGTVAVTKHHAPPAPPPPPGCEGTQCRRAKCGDICTKTDCSHFGNVCAGGAQAPAGPGWTYSSKFAAPELPSAFTSENATIFYYFNLVRLERCMHMHMYCRG
eukprot:COSAG02_NODE_1326_length_13230_cov_13.505217_4_plen_156_part_00